MGYYISKEKQKLCEPGNCTRCGKYEPIGRNTAGQCHECHNLQYREYQAQRKQQLATKREEGKLYWSERGVKVGQKMKRYAHSLIGFGGITVYGTAKVGAVGAYVQSNYQPGYLTPEGWEPC
jgi:hypothetical protein